jgi:hypothetical protein
MIARSECSHCRSNLVDYTYSFVSEDSSRSTGWNIPLQDVQIGTANRGLGYPDDRIRCIRQSRFGSLFNLLVARPQIDQRFHDVLLACLEWVQRKAWLVRQM